MTIPTLEEIWGELRLHAQWAEGFSIIFLFAGHPYPVDSVFSRLDDALRLAAQRPIRLAPKSLTETGELLQTLLGLRPNGNNAQPSIWVELWRNGTDPDWLRFRHDFLARLNAQRYQLEQQVRCPLILVLPEQDKPLLSTLAPDLWAIRTATYSLPTPAPETREFMVTSVGRLEVPISIRVVTPAEAEWARQYRSGLEPGKISAEDGIAAVEAAQERGALPEALEFAEQALGIARQAHDLANTPQTKRTLSMALDALGTVRYVMGELEAARKAYAESLNLSRQLRKDLGDTLQALRDLSLTLNYIGDVAITLDDLEAAHSYFTESLSLTRQLSATTGEMPQTLRDLSQSLIRVGDVSNLLGELDVARGCYTESLELARNLRETLGDTPETLRDLMISLSKLGDVSAALGKLEAARGVYTESLNLGRQLCLVLGDTPQALRDLSISIDNMGKMSSELGDLEAARQYFTEGVGLRRQLRDALGDTPGVLADLARALGLWGQFQLASKQIQAAEAAFSEGLALAERLLASQPEHPVYLKLKSAFESELASLPPTSRHNNTPEP